MTVACGAAGQKMGAAKKYAAAPSTILMVRTGAGPVRFTLL
jgi:hypothetical protein